MTRTRRTRMHRQAATGLALLLAAITLLAGSTLAQDATPAATPGSGGSVMAGASEITWSGDWQLDTSGAYAADPVPGQVTFYREDAAATPTSVDDVAATTVLTYGAVDDPGVYDPGSAIDVFAGRLLGGTGGVTNEATTSGGLDGGAEWAMYTVTPSESDDAGTTEISALIVAAPSAEGEILVTVLTAPTAELGDAVTMVQADFLVDGQPGLLVGIDSSQLVAELPATPDATPATEPEETPLPGATMIVVTPDATPAA